MMLLWVVLAAGAEPARVAAARAERFGGIARLFQTASVAYPPPQILLRAFKEEGKLELWAANADEPLVLLRVYPVCAKSGVLGPKRRRGDLQVPEGFYVVQRFNPTSNFHLSFGIDYPNAADRRRAGADDPGGDIFVHGDCVTIGCLPIGDEIRELYVIVLDTHRAGRAVPVHIFPRRLDAAGLEALASADRDRVAFWRSLAPAYRSFESQRRVPEVRIDAQGAYQVTP